MEEATGAPSSLAVSDPKRLRASGRDGETVMTEPPSPLRMLLSRHTKRREFIGLVGGAAAWPLTASAQRAKGKIVTIGILAIEPWPPLDTFRRALDDLGYIEGKNVRFEYRYAKGHNKRLPAQELADMACNRITAAITRQFLGERPIKALLDPYNHTGSTRHVRFNTSRADRWDTIGPPPKNQVNWVILDSDWESEFCRVAESHSKVIAYTKNHNLGLEVPYRYGSETRKYLPDFIVLVDDGRRDQHRLHLVTKINGYRQEDAKEKKSTMDTYWVPGVNHLGSYGRWAFAEFTEVYQIEADFKANVESEFNKMVASATAHPATGNK